MKCEIAGKEELLAINLQFKTWDRDAAKKTLEDFKRRYGRKLLWTRDFSFPFFGGLESRGHLHFHGITLAPCEEALPKKDALISEFVLAKIPNLHKLGHQLKSAYDPDQWICYLSKFENFDDEMVWI